MLFWLRSIQRATGTASTPPPFSLKIEYKSLLYKMKKLGIDDSPASPSERSRPPVQRAAGGD